MSSTELTLCVKRFEELTVDELYEILQLRVDVFVVEQNCPYRELDGLDRVSLHVFLKDEDGIEAYLRVLPQGTEDERAAIGRVIAKKRRCGLGSAVLQAGMEAAEREFGAASLYLEAQVYARGLYEKAGFRQISEEFLLDGIPHIKMIKE